MTSKVVLDDDTVLRLRRCRDGITRARCWHDGYRAGGGSFLWYDCLIDAQVICDRVMAELEKQKR